MYYYLFGVSLAFLGGILSLFAGKNTILKNILGMVTAIAGTLSALAGAIGAIICSAPAETLVIPLTMGSTTLSLDVVSAFFALPVVIISPLAAFYFGVESIQTKHEPKSFWFFFNLLIASMLLLLLSSNAVLFLIAWEVMTAAAFFLVVHHDEVSAARTAGWKFFAASHIGTAALFVMFAILSAKSGSFEFASFKTAHIPESLSTILFVLALIGFGTKAAFFPLHVWLPEAHANADAPVSAVLSAAMVKMGFYGLIRAMLLLPGLHGSWGWTLLIGGLITGIYAMIIAVAQSDIKKAIAYSSVENAGLIFMAFGSGIIASCGGKPEIASVCFISALFFIMNHTVNKGLLFLMSGAVYHSTGTRDIEAMGGLIKKMPFTAFAFGVGAIAISGLPPFNGFIAEFMLFVTAMDAAVLNTPAALTGAVAVMAGMALIGGLAAVSFTRLFGLVFLGSPRASLKHEPHEISWLLKIPAFILILLVVSVMVFSPCLLPYACRIVSVFVGSDLTVPAGLAANLKMVVAFSLAVITLITGGIWLRYKFFARGDRADKPTWGCGYLAPTSRIQYTPSSFSQAVVDLFSGIARPCCEGKKIETLFPEHASFKTSAPEPMLRYFFNRIFSFVDRVLMPMRRFQHGRLHLYIGYMAAALLVLLLWEAASL